MSVLWTLDDMAVAMRAEKSGALPADVLGISIDSRNMAKGEAFFAIKGDNRDGHDFVEAALKAGAGLAVVARDNRSQFDADAPLLIVTDVLDALRDLAHAARARSHAKIIAVTGSVGKTSAKEALRLALSADGETHASAASYNNHWGVPLSLARCPASAQYAVFEIGMNHAGETAYLGAVAQPTIAVLNNAQREHQEFMPSVADVAAEHATVLGTLPQQGIAVINADDDYAAFWNEVIARRNAEFTVACTIKLRCMRARRRSR